MWSVVVIGVLKGGEQSGEPVKVGRARAGGEPAFQGLVEAFDLALGLRVAGVAVLLSDRTCSKWFGPPDPAAKRVVKMRPLSVRTLVGSPCSLVAVRNSPVTIGAVTTGWQVMRIR